MRKFFNLLIMSIVVFSMSACGSKHDNKTTTTPKVTDVNTVEYNIARNYFFNNNVEVPDNPIVTTQENFEQLYGMAAVMGKDGAPTPIDFSKEFVIGIVLPITNDYTEIIPEALEKEGDVLTLYYKVSIKELNMSSSMQPMVLIIVDRKYLAKTCVLKETK